MLSFWYTNELLFDYIITCLIYLYDLILQLHLQSAKKLHNFSNRIASDLDYSSYSIKYADLPS